MSSELIDAAVMMNVERAVPILIDYVRTGQYVGHAAKKLSTIPDLDLEEPLRSAARNARDTWSKHQLVEVTLENGMTEGLDLAIDVLRDEDKNVDYARQQVADLVRRYTGFSGSYEQVADKLEESRDVLIWNGNLRRFE